MDMQFPDPVIALYPLPIRIGIVVALASLTWAGLIGAASTLIG